MEAKLRRLQVIVAVLAVAVAGLVAVTIASWVKPREPAREIVLSNGETTMTLTSTEISFGSRGSAMPWQSSLGANGLELKGFDGIAKLAPRTLEIGTADLNGAHVKVYVSGSDAAFDVAATNLDGFSFRGAKGNSQMIVRSSAYTDLTLNAGNENTIDAVVAPKLTRLSGVGDAAGSDFKLGSK